MSLIRVVRRAATRNEDKPDSREVKQTKGTEKSKMKCSALCVTVITAFIAGVTWADLQTPVGVLANESLDRFGYTSRNPVPDEIWELKSPCMKVLQVVDGGVLVERIASAANTKNFYVKTSRTYADGDVFATGYYRATGTL